MMVRVKSVPDPLPLNLTGTPETVWEAYFTRRFKTWSGFCWYQGRKLLMPRPAQQLTVALCPGVPGRKAGGSVSTVSPLEVETHTNHKWNTTSI